jgi:hypothetical protein
MERSFYKNMSIIFADCHKSNKKQRTHLDAASSDISDKLLDGLSIESIGLGLELGHLISEGDVTDGGASVGAQAEELQDSQVILIINVDVDEQNLQGKKQ